MEACADPPFFIVLLKIFNQNIKNRVKDFLKHLRHILEKNKICLI